MSRKDEVEVHSKDLSHFIDTHLRELRWTSYGLGAIAALVILRNIRATKKFKALDQIPSHFISKNYTLHGHVRKIADSGVLQIEHTPIIEVKWISKILKASGTDYPNQFLNILPAALDLTPDTVQWLKTHTQGKHAWFQMLARDDKALYCDIRIRKGYFRRINISNELLKHSLCKVHHFDSPPEGEYYNNYMRRLISLEHKASRRGKGIWKEEEYWLKRKTKSVFGWSKEKLKWLFKRNKD